MHRSSPGLKDRDMRDTTMLLIVFWGLAFWSVLGLVDLIRRAYRVDPRYKEDE